MTQTCTNHWGRCAEVHRAPRTQAIANPPVGDLDGKPISIWICLLLYVQTLMFFSFILLNIDSNPLYKGFYSHNALFKHRNFTMALLLLLFMLKMCKVFNKPLGNKREKNL